MVWKSRRIESDDQSQKRKECLPLDRSAIGADVVCSDSENAENRGPMHGKIFHAKIVQPAKYPPANGTREPHGATSRNVEE